MMRLSVFCFILSAAFAAEPAFVVEPYVQLGDAPKLSTSESIEILWHTADADQVWAAQSKKPSDKKWNSPVHADYTRVAVRGIEPHRVYRATLNHLAPGEEFDYRVTRGGQSVFEARARARKSPKQDYRFVVFGDCAQGTPEQRAVAYQAYQAKPDFVFIPGDIVYTRGLISEYRTNYFPVYNAAAASPDTGAPLIRSTLFLAAPGNHDTLKPDLTKTPDALAYFMYWSQPLNGPLGKIGEPNTTRFEAATGEEKKAFLTAAPKTYPRMANFSFDYGNAHWTVLDSNPYVDWTDPALRAWVAADLASAKSATWRFVGFHHPGFNSAKTHFTDQWMRKMSDVFETGGVDIVFAGHVHNYQRSYPLRFRLAAGEPAEKGHVDGEFTLDKQYDGAAHTKPNGVIYLVTGAGGAHLYNPEQQDAPEGWQAFTNKFVSTVNSLTVVDASGGKLSIRQVSKDGQELDRWVVTKK